MREHMTKENFVDALGHVEDWATIDQIVDALDQSEFWSDGFIEKAERDSKKQFTRRMIKGVKDETGFPVFASVASTSISGENVRHYKQESLFSPQDYGQVVGYHRDRSKYHADMADAYMVRAHKRYPKQMDLIFSSPKGMAG